MGINGHHVVRLPGQSRFHRLFAHGIGLQLVHPGGVGNGRPAQEPRLFCPGLDIQLLDDGIRHVLGGAAGDHVAKAVHNAGGGQGLSVQAADPLGDGDQQTLSFGPGGLDVREHPVFVHQLFRQVGQHFAVGGPGRQRRGGGDPAGVPAHELQHHHMDGQARGIQGQLTGGLPGVPGGGAEAGAVVRNVQVVVHGFGNADDLDIQAFLLGQLTDLVAGVHGVVAAVVEEAADVEFFQRLNDRGIVRVRQLPAAGADGGGGGVGQLGHGGGRDLCQVQQIPLENALGTEPGGVDLIHLTAFPGGFNHALQAGIDHGGRAAAVGHQNIHAHSLTS